jgi:thiol-disulfide isomerase/thioredoxin
MDPIGLGAIVVVLLAGTAVGGWHARASGRLRALATPSSSTPSSSTPSSSVPSRGAGEPGAAADAGDGGSAGPAGGGEAGLRVDPAVLGGLGAEPAGERFTLLQFSSTLCAPCRSVSRISSEVAGEVPGVRHVEIAAEEHLDAVKRLGIWRTPTLLVLDHEGRIVRRATGVPRKPDLIAAVRETF